MTEEQREVLAKTLLAPDGTPLNIFATLAHHPRLLKRVNALGGLLLTQGDLGQRERELVILRVAWRVGSVYEFGQHTVIGRRAGLTDSEIARVTRPDEDSAWTAQETALLAVTDELLVHDDVRDRTWSAAARHMTERQLLEVVMLVGFYRMLAGFLNAVRVAPEPGLPGWPA